jgi:16S rRNA (cytosine1402-N4)-methyltransferase
MSKKYPPQHTPLHTPVLLEPVLELLRPQQNETYLDLTAGFGGHAARVIDKIGTTANATLVDRDEAAIAYLKTRGFSGARILQRDFASAAQLLLKEERVFDMVLMDLGVSSPQLDNESRGFSFRTDAPLDMRMDQREGSSAKDLVNTMTPSQLGQLIRDYGEERPAAAKRIADAIVAHRPVETTGELARIIVAEHRGKWQKSHPATRTFQALRIAVNDELAQLASTLAVLPELLKPGGRLAVISFHSLEDRLVKQFLSEQSRSGFEASLRLLNKKPISGADYDVHNPRARSAKLRAAVKINIKERTWQ